MINYREGTFETNSSSTHSVVIVEDSQLEKWKNGELFYIDSTGEFVGEDVKKRYDKDLVANLVLSYSEYSSYRTDIAEAIKEGNLREYVDERIEEGDWEIDNYERPLSFDEYQDWVDGMELESDEHSYTTPNGELIHVFCSYGYGG